MEIVNKKVVESHFYCAYEYLSMIWLELIHISKKGSWTVSNPLVRRLHVNQNSDDMVS